MDTIEMIILITLSIVVGLLLIQKYSEIVEEDYFGEIFDSLGNKEDLSFKKVNFDDFVSVSVKFWEETGMCEINESMAIYIDDNMTSFNKSTYFEKIKYINYCRIIQSNISDCGTNDDVVMTGEITLPKVVRLKCNITNNTLTITG